MPVSTMNANIVVGAQPPIWAPSTVTTTITSTITATRGSRLYIGFPEATTTSPLIYEAVTWTSNAPSDYPTILPILVLTELDAVVVDIQGSIIETHTLIQAPATSSPTLEAGYNLGTKIYLIPPVYGYGGWTPDQQSAFRVAMIVMICILMITFITFVRWLSMRKVYRQKYEKEYRERRQRRMELRRQRDLEIPASVVASSDKEVCSTTYS